MSEKMAVVCNGSTPANIMPTLIFSSSGLSVDYEVHIFFCPAGANWVLKGELEKLGDPPMTFTLYFTADRVKNSR